MYVLFSNKIYSFATNTPLNNGQKGNFRQSRENMYISTKLLLRTVQSLKIVDNIVEIEKKNPLVIIMFQSVTHQKQKSKTFISVSIIKIFGSIVYISISLPSPFKCLHSWGYLLSHEEPQLSCQISWIYFKRLFIFTKQ